MVVYMYAALERLRTHLRTTGRFSGVTIGEPKAPPPGVTIHAAVFNGDQAVVSTTLVKTIERRTAIVRLYRNMLEGNQEHIERDIEAAAVDCLNLLFENFTLDVDGVRNVNPTEVTTRYGYVQIGNTLHRVADLSLSFTVDDSYTFSP